MFSYAALRITELFSMLTVYRGPTRHRSIVVQKDSNQGEGLKGTDKSIEKTRYGACKQPTKYGIQRQQVGISSKTPTLMIEPQVCTRQSHSPDLFLKRTETCNPLAAGTETQKEITFNEIFHRHWRHEEILGEGSDGVVHLYQQWKRQDMFIAVKLPRNRSASKDLAQEIKNMRMIGQHEHILDICYATENWLPYGPALFLPVCDFGNLMDYRESWCVKQACKGKLKRVSEITMWKLFRDMVLALNYLHHELGIRYVHNDFKPENVLVDTPTGYKEGQSLPEEPVFKLSDFARLTPWPTPKNQRARGFNGTPEYAPPMVEQIASVQTSADIWGLGATLQYMALGIHPVQSRDAFIRSRKAQGKTYPDREDDRKWKSFYWRTRIPTVYRPINMPLKVLQKKYDVSLDLPDYRRYSARLGFWYTQLWKPVATRPKASKLLCEVIPYIDDHIERLKLHKSKKLG